jgi:YD repeat-containing protein
VRKLLLAVVSLPIAGLIAVFAGPVSSGALFLLISPPRLFAAQAASTDPSSLRKGRIDLATGLYIREIDDLTVPGTPWIGLRRTYLSNFHAPRELGIGTMHPGDISLFGGGTDGLQWMALVMAPGSRIEFRRTSSGKSILNAMFVHESSPTEWVGAQLGWTGFNWALKRRDGAVLQFRACGPTTLCSITSFRESDGRTIYYRRDSSGRLLKMDDGGDRWIAFEYDEQRRVTKAEASTGHVVAYEYDERGRLVHVRSGNSSQRYTYTDQNELATIEEPGISIENIYHDGRVIRQVNRYPDDDPFVFDFSYDVSDGRPTATESRRSDGTWRRYTWDPRGYSLTEAFGLGDHQLAALTFERDPATRVVTALTLTCPDAAGVAVCHFSPVPPGGEERVKERLVRTHCRWDSGGTP